MQRYSYTVDVRIWHPSIKPEEITHVLGMTPSHCSKAGQQRQTPKGTLLEGVYRESYWNADPFDRGEYSSADDLVEDALTEVLEALEPHKIFIQKLRSEGARILLQVSSFSGRNYAFEFSPELLGRCAALGVGLAHDVYPSA
ncbi:MAG: DUF4279 domain-containing protein [Nitrospira sp.]